jgi:hypothetical protein
MEISAFCVTRPSLKTLPINYSPTSRITIHARRTTDLHQRRRPLHQIVPLKDLFLRLRRHRLFRPYQQLSSAWHLLTPVRPSSSPVYTTQHRARKSTAIQSRLSRASHGTIWEKANSPLIPSFSILSSSVVADLPVSVAAGLSTFQLPPTTTFSHLFTNRSAMENSSSLNWQ